MCFFSLCKQSNRVLPESSQGEGSGEIHTRSEGVVLQVQAPCAQATIPATGQSQPTMRSIPLKNVPNAIQELFNLFTTKASNLPASGTWRDLDSTSLQTVIRALSPQQATAWTVDCVHELFSEDRPNVALSYRWSASLGEIYDGLHDVCNHEELVWIDILFNPQNQELTPQAVLDLTPRLYLGAARHVLLVTGKQDLAVLLRRGWICYEVAVRMISDKPMVELVDPNRKAIELYQSGGLQRDFFATMETFDPKDKLLIQDAIRKRFYRQGAGFGDPEQNFNRGVGDFLHLSGGKMLVADLDKEQGSEQSLLDTSSALSQEMFDKGKYRDCLFVRECALRASISLNGDEHLAVATCRLQLVGVLGQLGQLASAMEHAQLCLDLRQRLLGVGDHKEIAECLHKIGTILFVQGDYKMAMERCAEALRIRQAVLGPGHLEVAASLNNIANLHHSQREFPQALERYEQALQIKLANLGPEHMDVALSLMNIGSTFRAMGDYQQALAKHEEALAIKVRNVGREHLDVALSLNNIALVHDNLGDFQQAISKYEEALPIMIKNVGAEHAHVGINHYNVATVRRKLKDMPEAAALFRRSAAVYAAAFGPEHSKTVDALEQARKCEEQAEQNLEHTD